MFHLIRNVTNYTFYIQYVKTGNTQKTEIDRFKIRIYRHRMKYE